MPIEIKEALADVPAEFVVQTKYYKARKSTLAILLFSIIWLSISGGMFTYLVIKFINGGTYVHKNDPITGEANAIVEYQNSSFDFGLLILPFFVIIGVGLLIYSLRGWFKKGGWFVATKDNLYSYVNKKLKVYPWKNFSQELKISYNSENGDIVLGYTSDKHKAFVKKMGSRKDASDTKRGRTKSIHYAEEVHIAGITSTSDIAKLIKSELLPKIPNI